MLPLFLLFAAGTASARFTVTCTVVTARRVVFADTAYSAPKQAVVPAGASTVTYYQMPGDPEPLVKDGMVNF